MYKPTASSPSLEAALATTRLSRLLAAVVDTKPTTKLAAVRTVNAPPMKPTLEAPAMLVTDLDEPDVYVNEKRKTLPPRSPGLYAMYAADRSRE